MRTRSHRGGQDDYRDLGSYAARVKSFTAYLTNLEKMVRVQVQDDARPGLTAREIAGRRIRELQEVIERIRRLV